MIVVGWCLVVSLVVSVGWVLLLVGYVGMLLVGYVVSLLLIALI